MTTQGRTAEHYEMTHQHPANRALHAIGIPVIATCGIAALLGPRLTGASRHIALMDVVAGSALLLVGHAIEGSRPAILSDRGAVLHAIRWWARGVMAICRRSPTA